MALKPDGQYLWQMTESGAYVVSPTGERHKVNATREQFDRENFYRLFHEGFHTAFNTGENPYPAPAKLVRGFQPEPSDPELDDDIRYRGASACLELREEVRKTIAELASKAERNNLPVRFNQIEMYLKDVTA